MENDKILVDTETKETFTYDEIYDEFERLKLNGRTEAETIGDYIENITSKNGTCEWTNETWHNCQWCGEIFPEDELREEKDLGYLCEYCISAIESRGEKLYLAD